MISVYDGDTTEEANIKKVLVSITRSHGCADYLIYSAGLPPDVNAPLTTYSAADWDLTFDTYVKGFLLSFRSVLPHMNQSGGHIVVIGSAITRFPWDSLPPFNAGHYAAAKAALAELVKWARREAHAKGALLSLISPGAVDTGNHQSGPLARIPKRLLPVSMVTDAVVSFLTGSIEGDLELVA